MRTHRSRSVACLAGLTLSYNAFALGLGDPSVTSVLGQPLQMTVPLLTEPGSELAQECVRIVPATRGGDGVPSLSAGRITLESERSLLRIESLQPISEPALRVAVEAGCSERIRREFALLLDPPVVGSARSDQPAPEASIGLGMAQISAVLGQRLSIKVPALGSDAASLTPDCVHLADPISSEGAPVIRQATIRVLPQQTGSLIEVATPEPVTEPAVRVALDVGCRDPLRREFAILLGLPTLAVSNLRAADEAVQAAPAPKPLAKAPAVTAVPVEPSARAAAAHPPEAAPARPAAHASGTDRLVLGGPQDSIRAVAGADVAAAIRDANAELLGRMEAMSRQVEALETQLAASRQRQQELERQASDMRERWAWMLGAFGVLLLGSALLVVWRQRPMVRHAGWEPVAQQVAAPSARPVTAAVVATPQAPGAAPEIGGRAPMPTVAAPTTEPSVPDDRHTHITVTELHDTVQVIKELYATVLQRNTADPASTQPHPPLELDLKTPTGGAQPGRLLEPVRPAAARLGAQDPAQHSLDERFTELPTEVSLDLDLSSVLIPVEAAPFHLLEEKEPDAEPKDATHSAIRPASLEAQPDPTVPGTALSAGEEAHMAVPTRPVGEEDRLTQAPTEVAIDIDVGPSTGFPSTIGRPAASRIDRGKRT